MSGASREELFFSGLPEIPPDLATFAKHYFTLPCEGAVPSLQTFLDTPPFALMPLTVIVDILSAEDFRIRYFGTAMAELVGKDYTGVSALESRAAGLEINIGTRAWDAARHPCGYLSKRTIYRRSRPPKLEAIFDVMTLTLPIRSKSPLPCILNYSSIPRLVDDNLEREREDVGYRISPICWADIGAGVPSTPI
jgi:hypothetical protein